MRYGRSPMEIQSPDRLIRLAVDLVNTRTREPERLNSPAELRTFLLEHGESEPVEVGEQDLADIRAVRERLRPVFHAEAGEAAQLVNGLLAEYAVRPYLSDHDGTAWHLHVAEPDASWAEWLPAPTPPGGGALAAGPGGGGVGVGDLRGRSRVRGVRGVRRGGLRAGLRQCRGEAATKVLHAEVLQPDPGRLSPGSPELSETSFG